VGEAQHQKDVKERTALQYASSMDCESAVTWISSNRERAKLSINAEENEYRARLNKTKKHTVKTPAD
jgi:hypothetical protein